MPRFQEKLGFPGCCGHLSSFPQRNHLWPPGDSRFVCAIRKRRVVTSDGFFGDLRAAHCENHSDRKILAGSFVAIALWLLVPDKDDSADSKFLGMGAFMATTIMFFLAEIGDKTQVATVVLAARFTETFWVILGTTVGMLLANIPVIMAGRWLMERLPLATARIGASVLFVALAVVTVWATYMNS